MQTLYFITAIDTDIGKTFFIEEFCRLLLHKKIAVDAIKPIASGFSDDDNNSDAARILQALNLEVSAKNIAAINPWRFALPASPHVSAAAQNQEINFEEVVKFCQEKISHAKIEGKTLLIEAAGGLMTPITSEKTFLDLAFELKIPVLLLSANYLGSISHTLCAAEVLQNKKIPVAQIIVNEDLAVAKPSNIKTSDLIETIENLSKIKTSTLNNFLNY